MLANGLLSLVHPTDYEPAHHEVLLLLSRIAVWISLGSLPLIVCLWTFALVTANTPPSEEKPYHIVFSIFVCLTAFFTIMAHVICNKRVSYKYISTQFQSPYDIDEKMLTEQSLVLREEMKYREDGSSVRVTIRSLMVTLNFLTR